MLESPVSRVMMTGFFGGCIFFTLSATWACEGWLIAAPNPAAVIALRERKSRRVVMHRSISFPFAQLTPAVYSGRRYAPLSRCTAFLSPDGRISQSTDQQLYAAG